ncbi:unnamed protein product [Durusdinium trenchii]|uniref:DUF4116 domain-containing protein n=1 Tax=Durusdinium trenchii TaxID=1381693 RepID=A0ABP0JF74_9DINO
MATSVGLASQALASIGLAAPGLAPQGKTASQAAEEKDFAELMKPDIIPKLWGKVAAQVQAAVVRDGRALAHAAPPLKQDKEVVLKAVQADGSALMFASEELQRDKEKMGGHPPSRDVLIQSNICLGLATALIADKEVALAAVKQSGKALQHCSEQLRNDEESWVGKQAEGRTVKDVCLAAVQQNGRALRYASEGQRLNRVVVDAAMENNTATVLHWRGGKGLGREWEEILTKRWKEQGFHLQRRKAGQILRAQTLAA